MKVFTLRILFQLVLVIQTATWPQQSSATTALHQTTAPPQVETAPTTTQRNATKDQQQQHRQHQQVIRSTTIIPGQSAQAEVQATRPDCVRRCTNEEFAHILHRISLNVDILRDFQRDEALGGRRDGLGMERADVSPRPGQIRPECIKQLVQMIKRLASGELEMKTLLEFASSTAPINLRSDLGHLRTSYAHDRQADQDKSPAADGRYCEPSANGSSTGAGEASGEQSRQPVEYLLGDEPNPAAPDADTKAQLLPKLVASVEQWLDTIERFTLTREWEALMRVFKGLESILNMFSATTTTTTTTAKSKTSLNEQKNQTNKTTNSTTGARAQDAISILVTTLERELPAQVQILTGSLNQLFPWHVWPWNNIDLYSTVDTFINHGIFAFSKTTAGPERRIDYLSHMLDSLFKSLKWDSFPKKCNDWSRTICDLELFYDNLAVAPLGGTSDSGNQMDELRQRREQVRKLVQVPENKLTQELVCIMFSSLSMQQFGGKDIDFNSLEDAALLGNEPLTLVGPSNQLRWDKQVRKVMRLYNLSREALSDEQWMNLQRQLNELWSQMKISDRVIMIGRIIQLLTNCHMPREILESALWKDIYKYKNALNQIGDIVIEELNRSSENGQFTIGQLAIGSKHLEDILTRFIRLLPRLLESLSRTITSELPELVAKFFDEKIAFFKGPCKGHSFSELVPSLGAHKTEIVELERLVCEQLSIKPSITMMQINNLTNEFLAMALNFTNLGGSFQSLPRLWTNAANQVAPVMPSAEAVGITSKTIANNSTATTTTNTTTNITSNQAPIKDQLLAAPAPNGSSSIVDELATNPRLAQIVAILQSSALDPPEVHAELPELDWVEAGTSVALFYESIQKLMSYEGLFVVFPEVGDFQEEMRTKLDNCKQMFTQFGKRDPIRLASYSLDAVMPIALRTFQPLESFHGECLSTFREIFGETDFGGGSQQHQQHQQQQLVSRESRQWQCAVSATNFASYALDSLVKTFNGMLRNILAQMSRQRDLFKFTANQQSHTLHNTSGNNSTTAVANLTACVLFDGSVSTLMDNLPQLVDLALETVLIASTDASQRQTLKETLCAFENTLDPLADGQLLQRQLKLREAVCHLLHESSLTACAEALSVDQWTSTMRRLNVTWFEASAISVEPSFRGIILGVHEFLDLFGKVKPSSMSDGLLARILNFNSYWTSLVNKATSSFEKYKERRFQVALQVLMPMVYENFPRFHPTNENQNTTKHQLRLAILAAKSVQIYLSKPESQMMNATSATNLQTNTTTTSGDQQELLVQAQLQSLFEWADKHIVTVSESLLRTMARNVTKLESLISAAGGCSPAIWNQFCSTSVDTYLEFEVPSQDLANKASLPAQSRFIEMDEARRFLCNFKWAKLVDRLMAANSMLEYSVSTSNGSQQDERNSSSGTPFDSYEMKQLVRVALTKWGQVIDLIVSSASPSSSSSFSPGARTLATRAPKFFALNHWKALQEKLPAIAPPDNYDPTNFSWLWQAIERLVNAADSTPCEAIQVDRRPQQTPASHGTQFSLAKNVPAQNSTSVALIRMLDQLNCALDTIKGGLTWDNMVNIYQDRQDVLAAHNTLNNGIALTSAGATTFLAHKKFQKFLNTFVKPRMGLTAFCEMRDKTRLEGIFSLTSIETTDDYKQEMDKDELFNALESFQEFICDTNLETLIQNVNPISVCYQTNGLQQLNNNQTVSSGSNVGTIESIVIASVEQEQEFPLANTMDRFFKLASLAVLDTKLVGTNDARPPIFDKNKWDQLRRWWLNQTEVHQGNSGLALTLVRVFQTLDSINSEHVVWRAIFRSFHELSEVSAYLLRAAEMELQANNEQRERGQPTKLALIREAAEQVDSAIKMKSNDSLTNSLNQQRFGRNRHQQQQLASTIANVMFPEVSNFITLRTFKQLRYIKSISDYFATTPGAQELICRNLTLRYRSLEQQQNSTTGNAASIKTEEPLVRANFEPNSSSKFELIGYKLNSNKQLHALLCHYHSSQWLTAMNIVLSSGTNSLTRKVNYMTKYLSVFTKNYQHNEHLQSFIHGQQIENIEAVANKTVSYVIALLQPFRTLTISKISNISWHSIPNLLESIDKHLCASKYEQQQQSTASTNNTSQQNRQQQSTPAYQLAVYEPKKPDIEVIICKLPSWNMTQVYNYFSENIDLQNMISLATQNNHTAKLFGIKQQVLSSSSSSMILESSSAANNSGSSGQEQFRSSVPDKQQPPVCITPLKFASKWLKIVQELIDEFMSKASKDKIRKCLNSNKKSHSAYLQTTRYVKILNSLLATLNDLTRNNSWPAIRRTTSSISYAILNQSGSAPLIAQQQHPAASAAATSLITAPSPPPQPPITTP